MNRSTKIGLFFLTLAVVCAANPLYFTPSEPDGPTRQSASYVAEPVQNNSTLTEYYAGWFSTSARTVQSYRGYEAANRTRKLLQDARNGTATTTNRTVVSDLVRIGFEGQFVQFREQYYQYRVVVTDGTVTVHETHLTQSELDRAVAEKVVTSYDELNASERATFDRLPVKRAGSVGYRPWSNETLTNRPVAVQKDGTLYAVQSYGHYDGGFNVAALFVLLGLWLFAAVFGLVGIVFLVRSWRHES